MAGRRLGALEGGGVPPPFQRIPGADARREGHVSFFHFGFARPLCGWLPHGRAHASAARTGGGGVLDRTLSEEEGQGRIGMAVRRRRRGGYPSWTPPPQTKGIVGQNGM